MLQSIQTQVANLENTSSGYGAQRVQYPSRVTELEKQMQYLCISANDIQKQQAILSTLSFDARTVRHQSISEAHSGTFQWAFSAHDLESEEQQDEIKLLRWLRNGQGIFWLTGRPGSGKSTFMKYIADNPSTRAALKQWSGSSSEPVISSHYFWIFGTQMQKSKEGLLRTLLFDIFRQYPALLKVACPARWDADFSSSAAAKPRSTAELRHVMDTVTSSEIDVKACFFIDGLDEYGGDHLEVSEELLRLCRSGNVKCCISSRPWNVFHDAFGQDMSQYLCLHNLTKRDIRHYVHGRLTPHPRWQRLNDHDVYDSKLIDYIAERSHGVFLWVALVTDKLRNGLTNDDDLSDLSTRLSKFPSDLENFFDHILKTVEPFYHEKMAGTLRLARSAERPLKLQFYEYHDIEYRDDEYFLHLKPPHPDDSQGEVQGRVQRRLNAYCKGLLEVHDDRVEFLHRTVADYLSLPDVAERLSVQSPEWFHPELSLAKVHLAYLKMLPPATLRRRRPGCYGENSLDEHLRAVMALASSYDTEQTALRDKFRLLLYDMEMSLQIDNLWTPTLHSTKAAPASLYFRERLLQSRLPNYLEKMLSADTKYLNDLDWPPLAIVMEEGCPSQHAETIKLLFKHGQNPNTEFNIPISDNVSRTQTPWTALLVLLVRQTRDGLASRLLPNFAPCLRAGIFDLFLAYGADPNAPVHRRSGQPHTTAWIDVLFASFEIEPRDEEPYLRVLQQLLRGASVAGVVPMGPESAAGAEPASETLLKRFFQLAQVLAFERRFALRVSECLVRKACEARWSLDAVWPEVRTAFGEVGVRDLRGVYEAEWKVRRKERSLGRLIKGVVCMPVFKRGMGKNDG